MANTSISGLASGLDTASIIDQLMKLEAQPQTQLKSRLTAQKSTLSILRDLNTKIAALATQAQAAAAATGWTPVKATSSDSTVTVRATSGTGGSFDVTVDQVAQTHRLTFAGTARSTDTVVTNGTTVKLTTGGVTTELDTGDGTLAGLVSALNAGGTGVRASTVRLDDGTERLVVQSATSGAGGSFTLTDSTDADLLGGATVLAGQDAAITIGADTVHSATNTFANALPGVEVTISTAAVGKTVRIDATPDAGAVKDKVKALVDGVNQALASIDKLASYDPVSKTSGPLAGDGAVRALRSALLNAVYPTDGTSMAEFGIQTDRTGKLVFDEAAFATAYAADSNKVTAAFVDGATKGFASRVAAVATAASDATTGTLTAAVTGRNSSVDRLQDSVASWDLRLELRRKSLTRQFTSLETALNKMNSQSNWLSGQLASLNKGS